MELLVYVMNDEADRRFVGVAIGEDPRCEAGGDLPIRSFAEVRLSANDFDPATTIALAVAKAFTRCPGGVHHGKIAEYTTSGASIRLLLAPGFDSPMKVVEPLARLLRGVNVRADTLVSADPNVPQLYA